MMQGRMSLLSAAACLAAGASVCVAQNLASSGPAQPNYTQSQPAPIERAYPNQNPNQDQYQVPYGQYPRAYDRRTDQRPDERMDQPVPAPVTLSPGGTVSATGMPLTANPIPGVILRVGPNSSVKEIVSDPQKLELRVESGIANINVHDPQKDILLLVDLPGGQTQMLKNGLYTFNAATNTARVLKGEALAFAASGQNAEPVKVKEYNKIEFGKDARPHEFIPQQAISDMIPGPERGPQPNGGADYYGAGNGYGYGPGYGYGYAPYGYYPYSYGYYPYYGFAEPYPWGPWGYPYGFYPYGIGIGFGYYGGWGYRGGFHGGGFHGRR